MLEDLQMRSEYKVIKWKVNIKWLIKWRNGKIVNIEAKISGTVMLIFTDVMYKYMKIDIKLIKKHFSSFLLSQKSYNRKQNIFQFPNW